MPALPPLIDADTLAAHLEDPALRVFDTTVVLERPSGGGPYAVRSAHAEYAGAHIPGAAFADIPRELSSAAAPFPFALPEPGEFAAAAGALGIGEGLHVVAYAQDSPMWATRLWWLLRYFGFDAVSVLDGGLPAWIAAGGMLSDEPARHPPATFTARARPELLALRADVEAVTRGKDVACLVNALTAAAFRGEGPTSSSRPGRIPGSVNAPWTSLIDPDSFRFAGPAELREAFERAGVLGPEPVIAYCGGGISATVDLFALSLIGREDARLYDGSLTEWSADPALPLELG